LNKFGSREVFGTSWIEKWRGSSNRLCSTKPLHAGGVHIWVADDAVCCELLSASNSLIIQGKYREFLRFWAFSEAISSQKTRLYSGFSLNSLRNRTGKFEMRSGNYFAGSGNLFRTSREIVVRSIRGQNLGAQCTAPAPFSRHKTDRMTTSWAMPRGYVLVLRFARHDVRCSRFLDREVQ
jgi:hypothetical protein